MRRQRAARAPRHWRARARTAPEPAASRCRPLAPCARPPRARAPHPSLGDARRAAARPPPPRCPARTRLRAGPQSRRRPPPSAGARKRGAALRTPDALARWRSSASAAAAAAPPRRRPGRRASCAQHVTAAWPYAARGLCAVRRLPLAPTRCALLAPGLHCSANQVSRSRQAREEGRARGARLLLLTADSPLTSPCQQGVRDAR